MTDASEDVLRSVAQMPENVRHEKSDELVSQFSDQLVMPLHRQILDCLVGRHCTSKAAQSWANSLIRESRELDSGNHSGLR